MSVAPCTFFISLYMFSCSFFVCIFLVLSMPISVANSNAVHLVSAGPLFSPPYLNRTFYFLPSILLFVILILICFSRIITIRSVAFRCSRKYFIAVTLANTIIGRLLCCSKKGYVFILYRVRYSLPLAAAHAARFSPFDFLLLSFICVRLVWYSFNV